MTETQQNESATLNALAEEVAFFNQTLEKARAFDMRPVVRRFMNKRGVSLERALAVADEMLRYLSLCAVEPDGEWTITGEVDEMWHTFVLFTQRYSEFCQAISGRFIHHVPGEEQFVTPEAESRSVADILAEKATQIETQTLTELKGDTIPVLPPQAVLWPKNKKVGWPTVCKPAIDIASKKLGASYADTLDKYHKYLGVRPNPDFWPSPDILAKPMTPQPCGACGGGRPHQLCGCGPIKDPGPRPKK
jgi:uncharacterized DUF497 family protein